MKMDQQALVLEVQALQERTAEMLDELLQLQEIEKEAWQIVQRSISRSQQTNSIVYTSKSTKQTFIGKQFLRRGADYLSHQLPQSLLLQSIAIFEPFFFDHLRIWRRYQPHSLQKHQLDSKEILKFDTIEEILDFVIDKELNELAYKAPKDWFDILGRHGIIIDVDRVEQFAECKASRDLVIHNKGVVNKIYLNKSGKKARHQDEGVQLLIDEKYAQQTVHLLKSLVNDISLQTRNKFP